MLCKCHFIVLYTVHFTAFCLGGGGVFPRTRCRTLLKSQTSFLIIKQYFCEVTIFRKSNHFVMTTSLPTKIFRGTCKNVCDMHKITYSQNYFVSTLQTFL